MLPLFHVHGLGNGIHSWLISGCRMRLLDRFDQRTTPAVMADFKPTLVFGVPTVYVRLLDPDSADDGSAQPSEPTRVCSSPARLRFPRTSTRRFAPGSATRFSSATA